MTLLFIYLFIALFFSFLCSVFEAVYLSVNTPFVESLKEKRPKTARVWETLKEKAGRPLAAILILNTVAHTVGAGGVGAQAHKILEERYPDSNLELMGGLVMGVVTILILVFSEIIPKTLGSTYWRPWSGWVGRGIRVLTACLFPLVWLSEKITSLFGKGHGQAEFSRDEMAAMVEMGGVEGELSERETQMLRNLVRVRNNAVEDVMTPRTVVFSVQEDMTAEEFIEATMDCPFSRIPIYRSNEDEVTGFVIKSEIAVAGSRNGGGSKKVSNFKREIITVNESTTLLAMFDKFLADRQHIALAVDDFGANQGIVTLEDVVETMLGMEIVDESDKSVDMQAHARDLWRQRARKMGIEPTVIEKKMDGGEIKLKEDVEAKDGFMGL